MPKEDLFRDTPTNPHKTLKMSLPLPPSVNALHVGLQNGSRKLSYKAKNYFRDARGKINVEIEEQKWVKQSKSTWLYIDLVFYMPDRRIRDSHNMLKLLLDVLQDVVYDNDYYVMPRIQSVELDKENPRVEFKIFAQTENNRAKGLITTNCVVS